MANLKNAEKKWLKELKRQLESGQYPKWPNEIMLKVLFGGNNYLTNPFVPLPTWKVLDVGCLFTNNLRPFSELGCECHGVDINLEMVEISKKFAAENKINANILHGSNRNLPFQDNYFDLILSIGTIHYEGSEENVNKALKEFKRVLKPKGGVFIITTGPNHKLFKESEPLGNHKYKVKNFDFRDDQVLYFFENEDYFKSHLKSFFNKVEVGLVTEKLMNFEVDSLVGLCR